MHSQCLGSEAAYQGPFVCIWEPEVQIVMANYFLLIRSIACHIVSIRICT